MFKKLIMDNKKGGLVNSHLFGYFLSDLRNFFISSLKKSREVETKAIVISTIVDSLKSVTHPASIKTKKPNYQKIAGLFEHFLRLENNLNRDNHFSCLNYNLNNLKVA